MVNVAIAGGSGGLGRAIVEAITAKGKHQVIVLVREVKPQSEAQHGVTTAAVDYNDVEAITKVLDEHQVDTVISTIGLRDTSLPEINLIRASDASKSTRRFIPSSWGVPYTQEQAAIFPPAALKLEAMAELGKTSLEYTRVNNGYFLDYWGMPKAKSYLQSFPMIVDMQNNFAAIPGSGDVPVAFTHTFDVAKFVAALLDLPSWDKDSYVIGDKVTWNEFVKLAEAAKGTSFQVSYDPVELLQTGQITELPAHPPIYPFFPKQMLQGFFAVFGLWFEGGVFDLKPAHSLNDTFPDIKPQSVKALLEEGWQN